MKIKFIGISGILLTIILIMTFSILNKESKEKKIWNCFEKNQETYYTEIENLQNREEIFKELSKKLSDVNEDLVFEFSPKLKIISRNLQFPQMEMKKFSLLLKN